MSPANTQVQHVDPPFEIEPPTPSSRSSSDYEDEKKNHQGFDIVKEVPPLATRPALDSNNSITNHLLQFLRIRKRKAYDHLDEVATQPSVYDTEQAEYYQPRDDWENIKSFDPSFRWTWRQEKAAIRKVDWKIFTWVLVMFLALDIDRGNLASATADGFLKDLNLSQGDYNLGVTLSKIGFLTAELPSQLVSKRLGPDRWIPIQIVVFSAISAAQFWLDGRASFFATRFLIAFFQGGFIPDIILYLSYYYTKRDLPVRLALFWSINYFADTVTAFLGVGLNKMRGIGGYAGWRWMFLIEGLLTLVIGITSFWMMPASPSQTKTKTRPKGYLTDQDAKIIVNRTLRDDPGKGGMHNRQPLELKMIWKSLTDFDLYPLYLIGLTFGIAGYPVKQYLQISFKSLGFSTVNANLLTVPSTVAAIFLLLGITILSEAVDNRAFVCMAENLWFLPPLIALVLLPSVSPWAYFSLATVLLSFPYVHAIQVAWCSRNSGSIRTRTVSASVYNMFVQVSSIIGANIYQAADKPRYFKGNKALIGVVCMNVGVIYPGTYLYYRWRNAQKSKIWDNYTSEQKSEYLRDTTDEGNKRLDFQFAT